MFQLKKISNECIPEALEKAERYRLLNEPSLAESICSDILDIDPKNTKAIITSLLAITDQFGDSMEEVTRASEMLSRLTGNYEQEYYTGIIHERRGRSILTKNKMGGGAVAYDWLRDAMNHYEAAEKVRPQGNDDAILRWNTCARLITRYHLEPKKEEYVEPPLE